MKKPSNVPPAPALTQQPSPTEQTMLTGTGAKPEHLRTKPHPVPSTQQNEAAIGTLPGLGDEIRVDVDRVPFMQRKEIHNRIIAASVNGQLGRVDGVEVVNGVHMLRITTAHASMLVPADCVVHEAHPIAPVQEGSMAPDKMHKPSTGSYKLT